MLKHEKNHIDTKSNETINLNAKVIDLVIPIASLVIFCIIGIFIDRAFGIDIQLLFGAFLALIITALLYIPRKVMNLREFLDALSDGFKEIVPAIIILTLAWTFAKITTDEEYMFLGKFISDIVAKGSSYTIFSPAILFILSIFVSVATGTSWCTFSILIPLIFSVFTIDNHLLIISIAAILSGSVCGDNISPVSDTTVMSCTSTNCSIINHISTQVPYSVLVAVISFLGFLIAGIFQNAYIILVFL